MNPWSWITSTEDAPANRERDPRLRTPAVTNGVKPFMGAKNSLGPKGEGRELFSVREDGTKEFRHALVQVDDHSGSEYVMVHPLNVDYFEEEGNPDPVPWVECMEIIEALLAPVARPPHLLSLNWRAGDYAIWDNRPIYHGVTPTHKNGPNGEDELFVPLGEPRLMVRTEMPCSWVPRLVGSAASRAPPMTAKL